MEQKYFYAVKVHYIEPDADYEDCTEYIILTGSCFTEIAAKVEEIYDKDSVLSVEGHILDSFFPISEDIFDYLADDTKVHVGLVEYNY